MFLRSLLKVVAFATLNAVTGKEVESRDLTASNLPASNIEVHVALLKGFTKKFGKPSKVENSTVTNGFGASFPVRPERINQHWSMDFVSDSLFNGRRFRVLTVVDDLSRECPVLEVDHSLTGKRVTRTLERIALTRGLPEVITVDNGPEFISKALDLWAYENNVKLRFIQPGKPTQNAFIESFNGKFREECLNDNVFVSLNSAQKIIENWQIDYNSERPHSSLKKLTPTEFAAQFKEQKTENTKLKLVQSMG